MGAILDKIAGMRVVPVVAIENAQDATNLADTLIEGGLPCAEITFRTAAALDAMRIMAQRGDILVGAGTVLKVDQVKAAMDVGAQFMVSPCRNFPTSKLPAHLCEPLKQPTSTTGAPFAGPMETSMRLR